MQRSRLLDPAHIHPSPPTVFAVSSDSSLLLSASEQPPVIYLQDLRTRKPPVQLQPKASNARLAVAAFHPTRYHVFLLGFSDGTLAAYKADELLPSSHEAKSRMRTSRTGWEGEISHFERLHVSTSKGAEDPNAVIDAAALGGHDLSTSTNGVGSKSLNMTGAAFLPGQHCRAVSVGADGRCRMVDFERGGKILRTWHIHGLAIGLSVLPLRITSGLPKDVHMQTAKARSVYSHTRLDSGPAMNNILAIGRADGELLLYDQLGIILKEQTVDIENSRLISVEWVQGKGPTDCRQMVGREAPSASVVKQRSYQSTHRSSTWTEKRRRRLLGKARQFSEEIITTSDEVHKSLRQSSSVSEPQPMCEDEEGTVRRKPVSDKKGKPTSAVPISGFVDLFSPAKQQKSKSPSSPIKKPTSPRKRGSLSEWTFDAPRRPTTTGKDDTSASSANKTKVVRPKTSPSVVRSTTVTSRSTTMTGRRTRSKRMCNTSNSCQSAMTALQYTHARVLADLKQIGKLGKGPKRRGLALLAPYIQKSGYRPKSYNGELHSGRTESTVRTGVNIQCKSRRADPWTTDEDVEETDRRRKARPRQRKPAQRVSSRHRQTASSSDQTEQSYQTATSAAGSSDHRCESLVKGIQPNDKGRHNHIISPMKEGGALKESSKNTRMACSPEKGNNPSPSPRKRITAPTSPSHAAPEQYRHCCCCFELQAEMSKLREEMHTDMTSLRKDLAQQLQQQASLFQVLRSERRKVELLHENNNEVSRRQVGGCS